MGRNAYRYIPLQSEGRTGHHRGRTTLVWVYRLLIAVLLTLAAMHGGNGVFVTVVFLMWVGRVLGIGRRGRREARVNPNQPYGE